MTHTVIQTWNVILHKAVPKICKTVGFPIVIAILSTGLLITNTTVTLDVFHHLRCI